MEPIYGLAKGILKPWLKLWFRWSIEGLANIPQNGPAILAFNHIAYLDAFAASYVVDAAGRRPRFLAKSDLFEDKRIAWILKGSGQIKVQRGTRHAPVALDDAYRALERGEIVVVFPEGTITTDPDLYPMTGKTGVARLALVTGAPLIPCALWGTANVWPKGYAKRWRPRQDVVMRIGTPLEVSGDERSTADWRAVTAQVMDEVSVLVAGLRPAVPDKRRAKKSAA